MKAMPEDVKPEIICKRWIHSREEDTSTEMVFRPASFNFPLSRGRMGFELRADRSLVEIGSGAADRPQETPGRWDLREGNEVLFYPLSSSEPSRAMQILSADADRLVIKK
jgi:hypothetical protein